MNHAEGVRLRERVASLQDDFGCLRHRESACSKEPCREIVSLEVLHDDVRSSVVERTDVEHPGNVFAPQAHGRARLTKEASDRVGLLERGRKHELEGHALAKGDMRGRNDDAHPSDSEDSIDAELPRQHLPDLDGAVRRTLIMHSTPKGLSVRHEMASLIFAQKRNGRHLFSRVRNSLCRPNSALRGRLRCVVLLPSKAPRGDKMRRAHVPQLVLGTVAMLGLARPAFAQGSQQAAAAQVLYDEGRRLVSEGHAPEGCAKLAESNRIDPAVGTRFYLADCYERVGRTASAWATFLEVATASKLRGHAEREALAKARAAALEPHLSKLTIVVESPAEAEQVFHDDVALGRASWGTAMPVDPGVHVLRAEASGRTPWRGTLTVSPGGSARARVPALATSLSTALAKDSPAPRSSARNVGLGLGAFGLVALGVGAFSGVEAIGKNADSKEFCDGNKCNAEGKSLRDDSMSAAWVSNISLAVGAITVAAGAYLFFVVAPSSQASATRVGVGVGPSSVSLGGAF